MNLNEIFIWLIFSLIVLSLLLVYLSYRKSFDITKPKNRRTPIKNNPEDFKLIYEKIFFNSTDGIELSGWFIPCQNHSEKTIIICHGWASNKGDIIKDTFFLAEKGFNLFYFDFRGCGESKDSNLYSLGYFENRDLDGAIKFLKDFKPYLSKWLGVYGCSMGGAVAVYGGANFKDIKAILAESTFLSFTKVVKNWSWHRLKVPYFPLVKMTLYFVKKTLKIESDLYSPIFNLDKLNIPILFINGDNDDLVSLEDSHKLFEICSSNEKDLWIIKGASHAKCPEVAGEIFSQRVSDFFIKYSKE